LLGIYIRGSAPEAIVDQVTCGDVGIEKAVIVPKPLYPLMLTRLHEFAPSKDYKNPALSRWGAKRALQGFLAGRCSKEFLALYLEKNPGLLDDVSDPGLFLDTVPEVDLAERLHELKLLPEDNRKKFVKAVSTYAIQGDDVYALNDGGIRKLFTDDEFDDMVRQVRTKLLPRLDGVRSDWESNHRSGEPPEEHMQVMLETFDRLKERFEGDEDAIKIIERETRRANEWIGEHTPDEPERSPRKLGKVAGPEKTQSERSIFDDIDADEDPEGE